MDDDFIQHSGNAFNGDDSEDEFVHVSYILISLSLSCGNHETITFLRSLRRLQN